MKIIFLFCTLLCIPLVAFSQKAENVLAKQEGNSVVITYEITQAKANQRFNAKLLISDNAGRSYSYPFDFADLSGDVGVVQAGKKQIIWTPQKVEGDKFKFKVQISITEDNEIVPTPEEKKPPLATTSFTETVNGVSFQMIYVEGGTFTIGSENGDAYEKPLTQITLPGYYLAETEVTQKLWRAVMGSNPPSLYNTGCDECPVERVSWDDIVNDFLPKLEKLTGKKYRLPSEAAWEYAARGGKQSKGYQYAGSNTLDEVAWYDKNYQQSKHGSKGTTHPVKTKKPNELGLYDMSGNVWEWCADDGHGSYSGIPTNGSPWIDSPRGSHRVLRGGSWGGIAPYCRVAYRSNDYPAYRDSFNGFRLSF